MCGLLVAIVKITGLGTGAVSFSTSSSLQESLPLGTQRGLFFSSTLELSAHITISTLIQTRTGTGLRCYLLQLLGSRCFCFAMRGNGLMKVAASDNSFFKKSLSIFTILWYNYPKNN